MMFPISATELFAGRKTGGCPFSTAVAYEQERLFSVDITFYSAADHWAGTGKIIQDLSTNKKRTLNV